MDGEQKFSTQLFFIHPQKKKKLLEKPFMFVKQSGFRFKARKIDLDAMGMRAPHRGAEAGIDLEPRQALPSRGRPPVSQPRGRCQAQSALRG